MFNIVIFGNNEKTTRVLDFWRLEYVVLPELKLPFWQSNFKVSKPTLFISRCIPSLLIWKKIYENPEESHISPMSLNIRDCKFVEKFCIYMSSDEINLNCSSYNSLYLVDDYDDPLFLELDIELPVKLAWKMASKFWYSVSYFFSRDLLLPLWIHEVQLENINNKNLMEYSNLLNQTQFSRIIEYEEISGTISDAIQHLKRMKYIQNKGYIYLVNERFSKHPLTLPGMIQIKNINQDSIPDANFTIVMHFYDLKLPKKPKIFYQNSLIEFSKVLHPIIFYADDAMCKFFMKLRRNNNLEAFTKIVNSKYSDWSVWNSMYQFESVTLMKPYIVMDAMNRNPFLSDYYIYMDPGIYQTEAFKDGTFTNIKLFQKDESSKVKMQKLGNPSSSDFKDITILCDIIYGNKEAWKTIFPKYDELVKSLKFYSNIKNVMSRLITLYPDLVELIAGGYQKEHYLKYLNI